MQQIKQSLLQSLLLPSPWCGRSWVVSLAQTAHMRRTTLFLVHQHHLEPCVQQDFPMPCTHFSWDSRNSRKHLLTSQPWHLALTRLWLLFCRWLFIFWAVRWVLTTGTFLGTFVFSWTRLSGCRFQQRWFLGNSLITRRKEIQIKKDVTEILWGQLDVDLV